MADKIAAGSSSEGVDAEAKRLGGKVYGVQGVVPGAIIVRQRGTQGSPGANVGMGRNRTLFAKMAGKVEYAVKGSDSKTTVSVVPA